MTLRCLLFGVAASGWAGVALGYLVGLPLSLDKLTSEVDLVFKGTAVSNEPVQDDWFKPYAGFAAKETEFKVISVLKGDATVAKLRFRHYDEEKLPEGRMFQPQYYHFEIGRTYLISINLAGYEFFEAP